MISKFNWFQVIVILCAFLAKYGFCSPLPDSAGYVPQPKGLSYGGIPYGSISGQLSLYFGDYEPIILRNKIPDGELQLL